MAFARRNSEQFVIRSGNGFMWVKSAARLCSRVFVTRQAAELAMERNLICWHSLSFASATAASGASCHLPTEVTFFEDFV
jgi:hypothetical protein